MRRARWAYDRDRREWRHLDASGMETTLLYDLRRVDCRRCGVRTELVPWADPGSRYTRDFETTSPTRPGHGPNDGRHDDANRMEDGGQHRRTVVARLLSGDRLEAWST